jgi:salicylate hydroxylase
MTGSRLHVAIVGGGIGGLTLAIALSALDVRVDVYEQAPALTEIGAGVALSANGSRVLTRLGLGDALAASAAEFPELQFRRSFNGELICSHPLGDSYRERAGGPFYGIHRMLLQDALVRHTPGECLHLGQRVVKLHQLPARVSLEFDNGEQIEADVAIGADGVHSTMRQFIDVEDRPAQFSGDIAFRGLVPVGKLSQLPDPDALQFWVAPGAHVLHYPINPDLGVVNFIAVIRQQAWREPTWRKPCDVQEAVEAFAGWHPGVTEMIAATSDSPAWWALHDAPPLHRWTASRLTLLGDAAHAMLPHQGQGANQAIEDAMVLAHCLGSVAAQDTPTALQRYERLRRARTRNVQRYSRLAGGYLHLPDGPDTKRRDADLAALPEWVSWIHTHDVAQHIAATPSIRSHAFGGAPHN